MSFTWIEVTFTYRNTDDSPAAGTLTFQLTNPITDGTDIVVMDPQLVVLDENGSGSILLPANDDSTTIPIGTGYVVTEKIRETSPRTYSVIIPYDADGGTVDLSSLAPATTVALYPQMGPQGHQGEQGFQGNQGYQSDVPGPQGFQGFQGTQGNNAGRYRTDSTTTMVLDFDSKVFFVEPDLPYAAQDWIIVSNGGVGNMIGELAYYLPLTGEMAFNPSNIDGFIGTSCSSWTVNLTGHVGAQGADGAQGAQGDVGVQGFQGSIGNQGSQGNQGFQGFQGRQGFIGAQGSQGSVGAQGSQGVPGNEYQTTSSSSLTIGAGSTPLVVDTGLSFSVAQSVVIAYDATHYMFGEVTAYNPATGNLTVDVQYVFGTGTYSSWSVNLDGAVGATGSQGAQGSSGSQGAQGSTGAQGPMGYQGFQGFQGSVGAQGVIGAQGTQGFQGNTGATGSQGFQGMVGGTGPQGAAGSTGAQGNQGATGAQGSVGAQGATGATGSQGATGAQGVQGFQGATGVGQFWTPGAAGWQAWTFDPSTSGTTFGITKGAEYFMGFISPTAITLNSISFVVTSAAVGPSNCYVGLYSQAGVLLATSADFSATLGTNTGLIIVNISYAMAANTVYYLGLLIGNGTTTAPTVSAAAQTNTTTAANPGATTASGTLAGGARVLVSSSSTLTALQSPVSGTPNLGNRLIWMGLK